MCLVVLLTGACCLFLLGIGFRTHRHAQLIAVRSCLLSVAQVLSTKPEVFTNFVHGYDEWRELTASPSQDLFSTLAISGSLDCKMWKNRDERYLDLWGNAIVVAHKKNNLGGTKWQFTSAGPDGRKGTDDDIIVESK